MELIQGALNKHEANSIDKTLEYMNIKSLPINQREITGQSGSLNFVIQYLLKEHASIHSNSKYCHRAPSE